MDEELQPEYGPRWSDQRVEKILGALVVAGLFTLLPHRLLGALLWKSLGFI